MLTFKLRIRSTDSKNKISSLKAKLEKPGRGFWVPTEDMKHKQLQNDKFPLAFTIYGAILGWSSFALNRCFSWMGVGTMPFFCNFKGPRKRKWFGRDRKGSLPTSAASHCLPSKCVTWSASSQVNWRVEQLLQTGLPLRSFLSYVFIVIQYT